MDDYVDNIPFTTSGALLDSVDKKVIICLRDGRKLIGVLRSYDQFANLVLQDAVERVHVKVGQDLSNPTGEFAEVWRGVYMIRGENVVLLGEIDLDQEDDARASLRPTDLKHAMAVEKEEQDAKARRTKAVARMLFEERGFSKEGEEDDRY